MLCLLSTNIEKMTRNLKLELLLAVIYTISYNYLICPEVLYKSLTVGRVMVGYISCETLTWLIS